MPEPTASDAVRDWLAAAPEDARALDARIRAAAPGLAVAVQGGMLAYGPFRYRYESGRAGESALVSLAVRKGGIAVYVNSVRADGRYVAESRAGELGRVKVGKSCITVPALAKLALPVFDEVVREAVALGGAGQVRA